MLDLARDIIGSQPILTAFLAIGLGYLVGQISIFGFLAWRRRGSLCRPCHRSVRTQGPDHRTDRPDRPDHVSLRDRHPLWPAILRGDGWRRAEVQSAGLGCMSGGFAGRARPGAHLRHQDRTYARPLCRVDDEHRNAPGCAGGCQKQGSFHRLLHRLSFRRYRPHPLHLFHDPDREAEIPGEDAALSHGGDFDRRELCRPTARRTDSGSARATCR